MIIMIIIQINEELRACEPNIRDNSIQTRHLFMCMICCEDYDQIDTFSLSCDHEYCSDCYGEYVKSEVLQGRLIRCMEPQCSLVIPHQTVQELYEIRTATETKNTRLYDFKFINVDALTTKKSVSLINNILQLRSAPKSILIPEISIQMVSCSRLRYLD